MNEETITYGDVYKAAPEELRSLIDRIERLTEEKDSIQDDIKDVYTEAKGRGIDVKVLRKVVSSRKRDREELETEQAIFDLYMNAIDGKVEA